MGGQLPSNADDAKRLRMEMQKIARETAPELMEALRAGASENTIVDILAERMGSRLGGEIVDVPASLVAPPQAQATAPAGAGDLSALASSVAGIQAQVILIQTSLDEIRDIARAWADAQGIGG